MHETMAEPDLAPYLRLMAVCRLQFSMDPHYELVDYVDKHYGKPDRDVHAIRFRAERSLFLKLVPAGDGAMLVSLLPRCYPYPTTVRTLKEVIRAVE
jgi:hypothetical protein